MKAKKSYKKGGRMEPIIGMPAKKKLEKLKPVGPERSMQVEGIMSKMKAGAFSDSAKKLRSPGKSVAEVEKPRRKKRRRKFENGGKTKKTSNVNLRGEGKKKSGFRMSEDTYYEGPSGPDYGDYINAEKAAAGRLKKMDKITPKGPDVIGLAKKVKPGTIKKSSAKIPVPAKKRRPRRK
jgi:hypothetical protein